MYNIYACSDSCHKQLLLFIVYFTKASGFNQVTSAGHYEIEIQAYITTYIHYTHYYTNQFYIVVIV